SRTGRARATGSTCWPRRRWAIAPVGGASRTPTPTPTLWLTPSPAPLSGSLVADTSVTVTVDGRPLAGGGLTLIRSVDVSEAINAQRQVSVAAACDVDNASNWSTPLDSLVAPFAHFEITIARGGDSLVVPARTTSASWSLEPGGLSTTTIAGLDASADLDREE